jgi:hypothetical protein
MPVRINLLAEDQSVGGGVVSEGVPWVRPNHINRAWIVLRLFLINTEGVEAKVSKPTTSCVN